MGFISAGVSMAGYAPETGGSPGFVANSAGLLIVAAILITVLSMSPVMDSVKTQVREMLGVPESTPAHADVTSTPESSPDVDQPTGRASDRDTYDFDLGLLSYGDAAPDEKS